MPFTDNLEAAMRRAGVSQSELARRLGIRSQAVNQWFKSGGTAPRGKRLIRVAEALGVDLAELLNGAPSHADQARVDLLAAYDAMDDEQRGALLTMAKAAARRDDPSAPIPIRPKGGAGPPENPMVGEPGGGTKRKAGGAR